MQRSFDNTRRGPMETRPKTENDDAARYASFFTGIPPPTYEDLYGRHSVGNKSWTDKITEFLTGAKGGNSAWCIICISLKIGIGIYYLNDCPVENILPVYLIVDGMNSIACIQSVIDPLIEGRPKLRAAWAFLSWSRTWLSVVWLLLGTLWIARAYSHVTTDYEDRKSPQYCSFILFYFALASTVFTYVSILCYCFFYFIGVVIGMLLMSNTNFRDNIVN